MLASQRQALILKEIQRTGSVRVNGLTKGLGVSTMTVRRDLEALAGLGLLVKVHGGATLPHGRATDEPGFAVKSEVEQYAKDVIAHAAAGLVQPGTAIGVGAGSTTYRMARHLCDIPDLTVVTNSPRLADALCASATVPQTVIMTGGVRTPSEALVGPVAVQTIRTLHLDQVFLGVHGADLAAGLTSPNLMESETNRALAGAARHLAVVADHTKWGLVGLSAFARLDDAAVFITDDGLPNEARKGLSDAVGRLVIAERTKP
jgi:DeoR/GlpR family transcriptional regulator of sugar metabolism